MGCSAENRLTAEHGDTVVAGSAPPRYGKKAHLAFSGCIPPSLAAGAVKLVCAAYKKDEVKDNLWRVSPLLLKIKVRNYALLSIS